MTSDRKSSRLDSSVLTRSCVPNSIDRDEVDMAGLSCLSGRPFGVDNLAEPGTLLLLDDSAMPLGKSRSNFTRWL